MPNQGGREQNPKPGQQAQQGQRNDGSKQNAQHAPGADQGAGTRSGKGNFADDRDRASQAGRKGGRS